jgi:hypothetical protein
VERFLIRENGFRAEDENVQAQAGEVVVDFI